ncbi:ATP-dependent helicase [Aeromicrobium sp. REDSEA-S32_B7]|uniref:ATP-dependent DNA helicase UvrD2 n=1 Tax=Aeromicrobium sp. REDSEA-S32_B7 TaxID=1811526 RepID=UPI000AF034E3|nr:ATP-dependent helicase [Aeromicrobium sp. REDSEA-S32_B7]
MPSPEDLLENLDPEQRAAAEALRGPVCIVAGAGTGKTRAITHRIAYGVATGLYVPTEVLALTFTTRAAGEMRGRLAQLGAPHVQARTFHSAALRQARYFWPQVYGTELPEVVGSKFGLVAEAASREGIRRPDNAVIRDLAAEVEWAKVSNVRGADYPDVARRRGREVADLDPGRVAAVMAAYEDVKRERGRIDFEDILLITAAILADDERIAAQVRRQYRWFVVDEYQDVNPLQSTLLDLWLGGRDDVCVVGDPRQTIYTFAGASPQILADFAQRYPDAERVSLVRNYRSTPQVVAVANAVFDGVRGEAHGRPLQAQAAPAEPVRYLGYSDEPSEASAVADEVVRLHRSGVPYREMAVLFRINAQSEAFEEALGERDVPVTLRGVEGYFQRAEVRQAVTLLRGAARAGEDGADATVDVDAPDHGRLGHEVRAVLASMGHTETAPSGPGATRDRWESLHALVTMADDLAESQPEAGLTELLADLSRVVHRVRAHVGEPLLDLARRAVRALDLDVELEAGDVEGASDNLATFLDAVADYGATDRYASLTGLVTYLRAESEFNEGMEVTTPSEADSVKLLTIHRSKGLEWDAVFCVGAHEGMMPITHADTPQAVAEERRLFYVGVTRARRHLTISWARARKPGGRQGGKRSTTAADAKVPAYVVFTDATLLALAELRPADAHGLVGIPGIGQTKRERYGEAVLEVIAQQG